MSATNKISIVARYKYDGKRDQGNYYKNAYFVLTYSGNWDQFI